MPHIVSSPEVGEFGKAGVIDMQASLLICLRVLVFLEEMGLLPQTMDP